MLKLNEIHQDSDKTFSNDIKTSNSFKLCNDLKIYSNIDGIRIFQIPLKLI